MNYEKEMNKVKSEINKAQITNSLAETTDDGWESTAIKRQSKCRAPNRAYIQDAPVPKKIE